MSTQNNDSHETDTPPTPATPPATPAPPAGEESEERDLEEQEGEEGEEQELRQTFDRDYVERLRGKSAGYRLRMKDAESRVDTLQRQLFTERLARLDVVVDLDAVPYDAALLEDNDALQEYVEELLESKPYLRKRTATGDIGQHSSNGGDRGGFSLLDAMRANAQ